MKKIIITALCILLVFTSAVSASDLSDWAYTEYGTANTAGLIPYSIASGRLTDAVTRAEFCEAAVKLYNRLGGGDTALCENPFTDTSNEDVIRAYTLGIINGKTETEFFPDDPVTRQEMAKMIMNTVNAADKDAHITVEELEKLHFFEDFGETDDWAAADIAKTVKYEIINGVSENRLMPKGCATREQAVVIISRAFEAFCEDKTFFEQPEITDLYDGITLSDSFSFGWTYSGKAEEYIVTVKDETYQTVASEVTKKPSADLSGKNLPYNKNYTVTVCAHLADGVTVYSDPVDVYYGTEREVINITTSLADKYNRVFPGGIPFANQADAEYNMTTVSVPVWKLGTSGEKYSSTAYISVNRNLSDEVVKIFTEIYKAPEKFPIKDVGGYSWRTTAFGSVSQHSYGTCIDINFDENYYCYPSGQAITGSFWKPYENAFSIAPDSSVVKAFSKYGWSWGGNWTSVKDYMHFSYLGN